MKDPTQYSLMTREELFDQHKQVCEELESRVAPPGGISKTNFAGTYNFYVHTDDRFHCPGRVMLSLANGGPKVEQCIASSIEEAKIIARFFQEYIHFAQDVERVENYRKELYGK